MILKSRKNHYLKRVGIFLIAVALIAGTISCDGGVSCAGGGGVKYSLTMAANPVTGGTATDLTNASPYTAGTVVNIQAVAADGYEFVNWTTSAGGTFANANDPITTFTMPAQNVTVTANFVRVYNLTMAVSPPGAGTTTPTGTTSYPAGTVVNIQAVANAPYQFVNWTAPAGGFANATAATTTFTMPAQDVTVTANFVGPLDHFTCYWVDSATPPDIWENVTLEDQFGAFNATVEYATVFGNPAEKQHGQNVTPIWNPDHHFTVYFISLYEGDYVNRSVEVQNQFGTQELTVYGPVALAVPTQKVAPGDHKPPLCLDHYLLYAATGTSVDGSVNLTDQFGYEPEVEVYAPIYFANPVQKTHDGNVTEIVNPDVHVVIYSIYGGYFQETVQVVNQFGAQALNVSGPYYLAVPSQKIVPPAPPLDHFKCYDVVGAPPVSVSVYLADQFNEYSSVQVNYADWFCNPVTKVYGQNVTPIVNPDNHLTVYSITPKDMSTFVVEVENQFGTQNLTVYGPVALAAPTWKLEPGPHGPPKYLDHYLLYEVMGGSDLNATVDLDDQFPGIAENVSVTTPIYFANPVLYKINYSSGDETGAWNPEAHLVFYAISDNPEFWLSVVVSNQFDPGDQQSLDLVPITGQLLAVPSAKVSYYELPL